MDKSKGVPVISVKTSGSKERVSMKFLIRVFSVLITFIFKSFLFFLIVYLFLRDRGQGRGRESQSGSILSARSPTQSLNSQNMRS